MMLDRDVLSRAMSQTMVLRNAGIFDRATLIMMGLSWLMAILMMALAVYTLNLSIDAKRDVITVMASEPLLPHIDRQAIDSARAEDIAHQLQQHYPDLHIATQGSHVVITSNDGTKFRQWLTALNDIDADVSDLRWSLDGLCVGKCPTHDLMYAALSAESISFSMPQ